MPAHPTASKILVSIVEGKDVFPDTWGFIHCPGVNTLGQTLLGLTTHLLYFTLTIAYPDNDLWDIGRGRGPENVQPSLNFCTFRLQNRPSPLDFMLHMQTEGEDETIAPGTRGAMTKWAQPVSPGIQWLESYALASGYVLHPMHVVLAQLSLPQVFVIYLIATL